MATFATRFRVVTAAAAITAATTLLPVQTAQAAPAVPAPSAPVSTHVLSTPSCADVHAGPGTKLLLDSNGIAEQGLGCGLFGLICIGPASNAPAGQQVLNIPLAGWWLGNTAICTFGVTVKKGPYGSLSVSRSSSC